ncbi:MAG TPA: hypothetical protein PK857_00545 [Hyphomicrobium sp.]|nr:hypothetical protein [Hyphomicrobium sp.]HRO48771.1 hypothetical protein [Hyphomicrobium sp.]
MIDAENFVSQLFAGGWDAIENPGAKARDANKRATDEQREAYRAKCAVIAKALGDEDGRAALALLVEMTLMRPPSDEETAARTMEAYAIAKAVREGQSNIVFTIFEMLRVASGADLPTGDKT